MPTPGASSDRKEAELENPGTSSSPVVAPTLTAVEIQAGLVRPPLKPSFPDATTVAMPTERRWSMMALRALFAESQAAASVKRELPPMLMFTAATSKVSLSVKTRSSAATWSEVNEAAHGDGPPAQMAPSKRVKI